MMHSVLRAPSRARLRGGLAAVALAALVAAGCGSSVKSGSGGGGGSAPTPGYDAKTKTFTVASLEPLSGPIGVAGQALIAGMRVGFDQVNAEGGINGKYKIDFKAEDSKYDTQVAVPIYNRIQDDTAIFSGILGTDILNALKSQMQANDMTVVVDSSSAHLVHETNLLPWATPAQINLINEMSYAADKLGAKHKTFCSITTPDDNGTDNREGDAFAAKKLGVKFAVDVQPPPTTTNYTPFVQRLQKAGCQVVMFGGITSGLPGTIAAASQLDYTPLWLGQNNTYTPADAHSPIAPYLEKHYLTALIGVPWGSSIKGMASLRAGIKRFSPKTPPSAYTELGYAHALFVEAVLKKAIASGDLTRQGVLKASQQLGRFDYDGLLPAYGYGAPSARKPPLVTAIYKVDPSKSMGLAPEAAAYRSPIAGQYPIP